MINRLRLSLIGLPLALSLLAGSAQAAQANPKVEFITNEGNFTVQLSPSRAPKTVANFMNYVKSGFYNGTIFHRVIPGFMIQGGGFTDAMRQKPTQAPIPNEARGGLPNDKYTIAMARTSDPHSATSQFFINVADNGFLNANQSPDGFGYAVFGHVTQGADVVEKISIVPTGRVNGYSDVPVKPIIIKEVKVLP